jgi:hypothetical protein
MGEVKDVYRVLVGRPEAKRPLGRPRRRREDDIKMELRETGTDEANWICMHTHTHTHTHTGVNHWCDSREELGIFLLTTSSITVLGSTQPPSQWVRGTFFPGGKAVGA